ncbi:MAG: MFS transporter [Bacteroidetes bacterium]|nr:MFS transporter [Bacteroidota bacterium]
MVKTFPYRFRVLIFLCSLTTLTYLDRICISIVGIRIKTDLGLTNEQFGWVLASFALSYALFEIPSGLWGDKIGPRAVFIRIVLWWSFFTVLTGFVNGLISLMVIRFLFGMGESGTMPNCVLVISRWFPKQETGRALPWMGIGTQIGSAIAPLIIIPLAVAYGWRVPFYVNGAIGVLWVLICYKWFRNFPSEMKNISSKEKEYIESNSRHNAQHGLIPLKSIFKNRSLWALMAMYFCSQWANYFFIAWSPIYLQEKLHFTEKQTQPIIFTLFIVGIIGLLLGGFFIDWVAKKKGIFFGRRFIGMAGIALVGFSILVAAISTNSYVAAYSIVAANGFYSFGVMAGFAVCTDIAKNNAGTVAGAMNSCGQLGAFFMSLVVGKLVEMTHSFTTPVFVIAAAQFVGFFLWFVIDPRKQLNHDLYDLKRL